VLRASAASKGQPTTEIKPPAVEDPSPALSRPRTQASSPDSGEPRRPPP
jgi:hypothetical protein